jgi:hypothetical protein
MELTYKLEASSLTARRPSLYLVSIGGVEDGRLAFKLPPFDGAKLEIDGRRYRLVAGSLIIYMSDLPDGLIAPKLILDDHSIHATPFIKKGNEVSRPPLSLEDYAELRSMIGELEARLDAQAAKIAYLSERVSGKPLFNFYNEERKQNEEKN